MDAEWLRGRQVCFTGKLASMTRAEAEELVRRQGGRPIPSVTRFTALLVVGQEGWPLQADGRLTHKLQKAHKLQLRGHALQILAEEEFLRRLGLEDADGGIHRRYTCGQLCRLLQLSRDRLRAWVRAGLVEPVETRQGVHYFDFQQVTGAKLLCDLTRAGVTAERLRKSLEQLRHWLPDVHQPLAQLAMIERDGQLLVRLDAGQLAEPSGQLQFDFAAAPQPVVVEARAHARTADEWAEAGAQAEDAGQLRQAAEAYRQALLAGGPDATLSFNLANVLYLLGQKPAAIERYRQAVELDPLFAAAWNNLGIVLGEMDWGEESAGAFRRALAANPNYADAHYNLADTLDELGRAEEARPHWQAYLRLEPYGQWADHARRRLAATAQHA